MIVIDSSAWLHYFLDDALADAFAVYAEGDEPILVPAVVIYEVYKTLRREVSQELADEAALHLSRLTVVPFDSDDALAAADTSLKHGLPFADSMIYSVAEAYEATLVTSDTHFAGLPGVEYIGPETTP
ncbi:MAG: type II toxin-antitoxin system VapC family toxin [Armatimonadetes bacterium]|nr:type II toxin-antitoxin system VapC family toxin [Armatimonadota bacterium]